MRDVLRFGRAEVRPRERQLLVDGVPAGVGARAFDLLMALIERRDRLVTKSELLDAVWHGLVVEENNLQVQISALRKALGPQAITTVPGRGYRLTVAIDGAAGEIPSTATADPALRPSAAAGRTNLPAERPAIYGRDDDLRELTALVNAHRVVTVVGAGGIGKSRLAQAAAQAAVDDYPDGAWMVELAGLSETARLPNTVAGALGLRLSGNGAPLDELMAGVAGRRMLLVLDNCEHLLEAVGALVETIRRGAPGVTLMATSQEPLHVADEQQFRVVPLAIPATNDGRPPAAFGALALFEARVRAVDPRFAMNAETTPLAIDICRRLDGLPLAIELAAARVGTLGLRGVRDKLDARFKLLTGGARAALRRHQTLRAALEWSHALLNEGERAVFRRLGVFAGGFTMELVQAVAVDETLDAWDVLEHLSALVDKSLVVADASQSPRYRLLETTRAFALEQLAGGETAATLRRHALALLAFLRRVDEINQEGELRTDEYAALAVPELDNLRAAYAWASGEDGDPAIAIALAAHAGSLIDYAIECADWLLPHRARVAAGAVDDAVAARYWRALAAGNMAQRQSLTELADAAERACTLYRALGRPRQLFASLSRLAFSREMQQDAGAAHAALTEARALLQPDWPVEFHMVLLRRDAALARVENRLDDALACYRTEVRIGETSGDWRLQAIARNHLIDALWEAGHIDEAEREGWRLCGDLEQRPATVPDTDIVYANLVGILSERGKLGDALRAARILLAMQSRHNCGFLEEWAYLFACCDQPATAAMLLGQLEASYARTGQGPQVNERRLIEKMGPSIEAQLAPEEVARYRTSGAALDAARVIQLLADTLARAGQARDV